MAAGNQNFFRLPTPAGAALAVAVLACSLRALCPPPVSAASDLKLSRTLHLRLRAIGMASIPAGPEALRDLRWLRFQDELRRRAETPEAAADDLAVYGALLTRNGLPGEAVRVLELVRERGPDSAAAANDLAVAYYNRSLQRDDPLDLFRALAEIHRSLALEESPQARSNEAVLLGMVGLSAQEESGGWRAWQQRLRAATEAGRSSQVREIARRFPAQARKLAEFELLGRWAATTDRDPERAAVLLAGIAEIGNVLSRLYGEDLLRRAAESFRDEQARGGVWGPEGVSHFRDGLAAYQAGEYSRAMPEMLRAYELLDRASNPFRLWSRFYVALCHYQNRDYPKAEAVLVEIHGQAAAVGSRVLSSRASFVQGLMLGLSGRLGAYGRQIRLAIGQLEGTPEYALLANYYNELATLLSHRGDTDGALRFLARALRLKPHLDAGGRRSTFEASTGYLLSELGLQRAAAYFFDAAVREARWSEGASGQAQALRLRANNALAIGQLSKAERDVREALDLCREVPEESSRDIALADVLQTSGRVHLHLDAARAEADLKAALELFAQSDFSVRLPETRLALARTLRRLERDGEARESLRLGIAEIEQAWSELQAPRERTRYLDARLGLYDELIELELDAGRAEAALEVLEASRARNLKQRLGVDPGAEISGRGLHPREAVLQFFVTESEIVSWVITRDATSMQRFALEDRNELRRLIQRVSQGPDPPAAERLYQTLIAPVAEQLDGKTRLMLAPDKELWSVPFAALRDPAEGRLLVESFALGIAPSLLAYRALAEQARIRSGDVENALLIAYENQSDADTLPLEHAVAEVREVASVYRKSQLVTGDKATLESVIRLGESAQVVHLAAHARDDLWRPWNSRLQLAPDAATGHDGLVLADDLERVAEKWGPSVRLIVLAACSTGVPVPSAAEGLGGLIQPFLSYGIPTVLASLWKVDDRVSRELLTRFHDRYRDSGDVLEALRHAQLELLREPEPEHELFAFQAYGAVPRSME